MSRVRKLSVRGIRNFGDDKDDEDLSIRFSCPLTLIFGPNGTGKTSIIEALKYAITGQYPSDTGKNGKSFIHDSVLAITGSVRSVVGAEIIDSRGNTYTISRTIESSKGEKKFPIYGQTLTRVKDKEEEPYTISNKNKRCTVVDTELCLALGVSKTILNYVVFCHQDELNWPFYEGKTLNERLDEIFEGGANYSRYTSMCVQNEITSIMEKEARITNILATRRKNVDALKQQVKDQERRLVRRNQLLNDALKAWDSDVTEMGI